VALGHYRDSLLENEATIGKADTNQEVEKISWFPPFLHPVLPLNFTDVNQGIFFFI
jgi:hypothetical protein